MEVTVAASFVEIDKSERILAKHLLGMLQKAILWRKELGWVVWTY